MVHAYSTIVNPRTFQVGELMLVLQRLIIAHRGCMVKFKSMWEGSFIIEWVYQGGSYQLDNKKGENLMFPINRIYLKILCIKPKNKFELINFVSMFIIRYTIK